MELYLCSTTHLVARTGQLYNLSYLLVTWSPKNSDASHKFEYYLQLLTFIFTFRSHHFLRTFPIVIPSGTVFFQGLDRSNRHQLTGQALLTSCDVTLQSPLQFLCLTSAPVRHQHIAIGQILRRENGVRYCCLGLLKLVVWRETKQTSSEYQMNFFRVTRARCMVKEPVF